MKRSRTINVSPLGNAVAAVVLAILILGTLFLGITLFVAVHDAVKPRMDRYYNDNPLRGGGLENTQ